MVCVVGVESVGSCQTSTPWMALTRDKGIPSVWVQGTRDSAPLGLQNEKHAESWFGTQPEKNMYQMRIAIASVY